MKKMKYSRLHVTLLAVTAALIVTACGTAAKAPDKGSTASEAAAPESDNAADPAKDTPPVSKQFNILETGGTGDSQDPSSQVQPIKGAEPAEGEALDGIPIDTEKAEAVSIYYGAICYSYFSEEKDKIKAVSDLFRGFSLEEAPDGQMDEATTYQVYFSTDTEQIGAVNVDRNGMFYIPEEKKFYKIKAGTFHLEELDQIYKDGLYLGEGDVCVP